MATRGPGPDQDQYLLAGRLQSFRQAKDVEHVLSGSTAFDWKKRGHLLLALYRLAVRRKPVVGWITQRLACNPVTSTHPVLALISFLNLKTNSDGYCGCYEQIVPFLRPSY